MYFLNIIFNETLKKRVTFDLVFVKSTHQPCSVVMPAILSEFSRCSSEIFDAVLLYQSFILEKIFLEMYVLLKAIT